ncbi:Zn-dependent protease [Alkalibaculum bacchi]|uniref:Zn-dependent protease n=1 Tax=Alkalibaculum bacchi TaxID=645887 RepID=A0A366IEW4_9FIRM|nr:site-2 protease family protein [Alkalibaculum bacchi]RBP68972.1 Zn-dependent protease [Alkalibaculum bacchi]
MKPKVNLLFLPVLLFAGFFGGLEDLCVFFIAVCIHDLAHYLVAKYYDVPIEYLEFMPFGCKMKMDDSNLEDHQKFFIYLSGPLTNILLSVILYTLKAYKIYYFSLYNEILFANLCIGFLNILPFHPLDGSVIFRILLSKVLGNIRSTKIMFIITQLFAIFLLVITIYSLAYNIYNISYGIVGAFLLVESTKEKKNILIRAMEWEMIKRKRVHKKNQIVKSERICTNVNSSLKKIMSNFNGNRYYFIDILDGSKYLKTITEEDVIEGIIRYGYDGRVRDLLN